MTNLLYFVDKLIYSSGINTVLMSYVKHIDKKQFSVSVLSFENSIDGTVFKWLKDNEVTIYFIPRPTKTNFFFYKKVLNSFFAKHENRFDILHSHFCLLDSLMFPIAKKYGVQKCFSHSHNSKFSDYFISSIRNRFLCRNITKEADYYLACSREAGFRLFGSNFANTSKSYVIPNGIEKTNFVFDKARRCAIRKQLGILDTDFVLGAIGGLRKQKNHVFLLKLVRDLIQNNNNCNYKLIIVGEGLERKRLEQIIDKYCLSNNVLLVGEQKETSWYYNAFDIFLLPSKYEGLGIVAIEAQYNGLLCLVSDSIPQLTRISDRILFLPLNNSAAWYNHVIDCSKSNYARNQSIIKNNLFEANFSVKQLEKLYLGALQHE